LGLGWSLGNERDVLEKVELADLRDAAFYITGFDLISRVRAAEGRT